MKRPEEQFDAVIETIKALFCETMDDNHSVLFRKYEEGRKSFDGEEFVYSIPVSLKIKPVMAGVYDVQVSAAPSSKAKLGGSTRINTEKDLVDQMNESDGTVSKVEAAKKVRSIAEKFKKSLDDAGATMEIKPKPDGN